MLKLEPPSLIPGCLTDLDLDLWVGDELSDTRKQAYQTHVSTCSRCAQRLELWQSQAREFRARFPSVPMPAHDGETAPAPVPTHESKPSRVSKHAPDEQRRSRVPRYLGGVGGLLALAATLVLWLRLPSSSVDPNNVTSGRADAPNEQRSASSTASSGGVRAKGSSHLDFFVKRGAIVLEGAVGTVVHPTDQIRFAVTVDRPQYVTILSLDAKGVVSVYYPPNETAELVQPSGRVALPSSVLLDATLGEERVWGVFCSRPVGVRQLEAELARTQTLSPPSDCTADLLSWNKQLP